MRPQRGGVKRDKTDALFSELVRERANWVCEYCKRDLTHDRGRLHCSHHFGRRNRGIRYHPLNASAHCIGCHQILGDEPIMFGEWVKDKLGDEDYAWLLLEANRATKLYDSEKEELHRHYLAERRRMRALRSDGETGPIEFTYLGG